MVDSHQTSHELVECGAILKHDTRNPKMIVPHGIGQQDGSELFQVVDHGLTSGVDEIPAQE
jgi:hypothetical protein